MARHNYTRSATDISPKVAGGAAAGAVVTIIAWAVETFTPIDLPGAVEAALVVLLSAAVGYLIPDRR